MDSYLPGFPGGTVSKFDFADLRTLLGSYGTTNLHRYPGAKPCNIGYHIYTDDTQLYILFKFKDPLESLTKLNMCISDIRVWMIKNKLKINDSKTEFIIFRSPLLKQNLRDLSCQCRRYASLSVF